MVCAKARAENPVAAPARPVSTTRLDIFIVVSPDIANCQSAEVTMFTEADDAIEFNFYVKKPDREQPLSQLA
jgi:hypothetical protein